MDLLVIAIPCALLGIFMAKLIWFVFGPKGPRPRVHFDDVGMHVTYYSRVGHGKSYGTMTDAMTSEVLESDPRWVPDECNLTTGPRIEMFHLDGTPWFKADLPPRIHRCTPQTRGYMNFFETIERCACGAMRHPHRWDNWSSKNERKRP